MHIVLYHYAKIPPKSYGGTERVIFWLAQALVELGHQVTLMAKDGSAIPGVNTIGLNENNHAEWPSLIPTGPSAADIVHLHATPSVALPKPFLITIHGNGQPEERFHPNSVFLSRVHAQNHGSEHFVYNGINPEEYSCETKRDNYLVFLAKASWSVKNLSGAIQVAQQCKLPLVVLGSRSWPLGIQKYISRALSFTLGEFSGKKIWYFGMANDVEKRKFLSRARGLLFPVRWHEPFGLAITEALASGCPVFGTPYGSLPELVPTPCGKLSAHSSELSHAILTQKYDPLECRAQVSRGFTHLQMAKKYLSYYEAILKNGSLQQSPNTQAPKTSHPTLISKELLPWD